MYVFLNDRFGVLSHLDTGFVLLHDQKHIKDLVHQTAMHVMNNGGVVRRIYSLGTLSLPQRMHRHKQYHQIGE